MHFPINIFISFIMRIYPVYQFYKKSYVVAHVLSDEEILSFFKETDRYHPKLNAAVFKRLGGEINDTVLGYLLLRTSCL